jgi:hypothetical protein
MRREFSSDAVRFSPRLLTEFSKLPTTTVSLTKTIDAFHSGVSWLDVALKIGSGHSLNELIW